MGQQAGKPAWPKPTGGYQTITGRRYRRRHTCVGFRPSLNSQDGDEHHHNEGHEQLDLEDVQKENCLGSSPLVQISSGLLSEPFLENIETGEPISQSISSQTFGANTAPFSLFSYGLEGNQFSRNFVKSYENSEDLEEYASGGCDNLSGQNGIAFVNIDSYEPDSSDGEEDDAQHEFSLAREEANVFQETLGNMLSELEKGIESFTDLQSQLSALNHSVSRESYEETGPMPLMRYFSIDSDLACPNNRAFLSSAENQAILKGKPSGANYGTQQKKNTMDADIRTPIAIANELNISDGQTDQGDSPNLVVRPKIRKNTANQLEREKLLPNDDEEESGSWKRIEIAEYQQGYAEYALQISKEDMSSSMVFDLRECEGHLKNTDIDLRKNAAAEEPENVLGDWEELENYSRNFSIFHKDEESSECSDGEWFTPMPTYFTAAEKEQYSNNEGWTTVPGREERDPELWSSSAEEEIGDCCFQEGKQILLEEGEIPWLQYRQEAGSSSDEENDPVSDFIHPGFFLLDGNNNLEDDSSVSEDLDVEWRTLDDFGDGLGLAQAIPYMEPQFLTFMALEGQMQAAIEAALAQLEAFALYPNEAHPPASKEAIDRLPQIFFTDDHDAVGQDRCCTICCSDYVRNEIITELPCHHLFHRCCVTLWLQTSGTCPICRHVLAPVLPEANAVAVPFQPDNDARTSAQNDREASN